MIFVPMALAALVAAGAMGLLEYYRLPPKEQRKLNKWFTRLFGYPYDESQAVDRDKKKRAIKMMERAARKHFGKELKELTDEESEKVLSEVENKINNKPKNKT